MTRIAVVDDDLTLLDLMSEILAERDWEVIACSNAQTAIRETRQKTPSAIILDIRLSAVDSGWDILRQLKADASTRSIPVIVWSGDVRGLEDKRDWLDTHGIPVLPKPFEIEALFGHLDAAVNPPSASGRQLANAQLLVPSGVVQQ